MGAVGHSRAFAAFTATGAIGILAHMILVGPYFWATMRIASGLCIAGCYTVVEAWLQAKVKNENVKLWGSGKPLREFLHVDDLAEATIFCIENWHPSEKSAPKDSKNKLLNHINIGSGKDISIKGLASKIAEFTNFKGEIIWDKDKPDGTPRKLLDSKRIRSLGWQPKVSLENGINLFGTILIFL